MCGWNSEPWIFHQLPSVVRVHKKDMEKRHSEKIILLIMLSLWPQILIEQTLMSLLCQLLEEGNILLSTLTAFLGRWGKVLNCSNFRVLLLEWWLVGNGDMVSTFVSDLGRWGLHPLSWWVLRFLLELWEKENRHYSLLVSLIFRPNQRKKNKTLPLDSAWLTGVLLWHKILACRKYYISHIAMIVHTGPFEEEVG